MEQEFSQASYENLLREIKRKYTDKIALTVNEMRLLLKSKLTEIIGDSYSLFKDNYEDLSKQIKQHRIDYFSSNEYKTAQKNLSEIRSEIQNCSDVNKKALFEHDLKTALDKITTLNIKCENQLRDLKERQSETVTCIKALLEKHKDKIKVVQDNLLKDAKKTIAIAISGYNEELKRLNKEFGIEAKYPQLPFDDEFVVNLKESTVGFEEISNLKDELIRPAN